MSEPTYQCNHWSHQTRCLLQATHRLFAPDGKPNPGGRYCKNHGEAIVDEYKEKLHEEWKLEMLNP